jgi:hypothetical protein
MKRHLTMLLAASLCGFAWGTTAAGETPAVSAAYANVEVVSVDPSTRLVVIKNSNGVEETFELDANVAGTAGIKAGDRAILTVRGEPGRRRVSAIAKATEPRERSSGNAAVSPLATSAAGDGTRLEVKDRFTNQVAALSLQGQSVDALWASFVTSCDAKPASGAEGGRDWFGLWDGRVKSDLSSGFCRDLFNQIVTAGEGVKKGMAAAEEVARKTLDAGELREIKNLHAMNWEGFTLPAPAKLEP